MGTLVLFYTHSTTRWYQGRALERSEGVGAPRGDISGKLRCSRRPMASAISALVILSTRFYQLFAV